MSTVVDSFGQHFFRLALIEAVMVGALAGAVGVHVLLRRLPFFVVAMSHATFPGVVFGSLLGVSLFAGGAVVGIAVALLIVALGSLRQIDDSSAIGIVLAGCFAVGVLVLSAGVAGNCLRFLSPLIITDEQLEEALDVLERCIEEAAATRETSPPGALANPI